MRLTRLFHTTGFRLAAIYLGLFGFSVLVLFGVIYWITGEALRQQLSTTIEIEVTALIEVHQTEGLSAAARAIEARLDASTQPEMYYLLLDSEGVKIAGNLPVLLPETGWRKFSMPDDLTEKSQGDPKDMDDHQILTLGAATPDGGFLVVGNDVHRIAEVEETIIRAFIWAFAAMVVLGALGGSVLSLSFLRRVDAINKTAQAVMQGKLADRVPTRGTDDEFDRLARNLNEMLDRVQALMESLREVSNDIAHDLRTPLSRLRQHLEGVRLNARGIEDYESAVDQAIADTDTILSTFAALLRIAQIEAGTRKAAFTSIDLSHAFQSITEVYAAVAEDRGQVLAASIAPDIHIRGDRELITQMLSNLVENAIRHAPRGAHIGLALENGPTGPMAVIADSGPGIPAAAREKVFQRFFRLEQSRSTTGNGLGLSLVAAVAGLHDVRITLADNEPGLKVLLDFPMQTGA